MEKTELSTYHTIRKAIKVVNQDTNWRTHTIIINLQNHQHTKIPNPPNNPTLIDEWIKVLGTLGKTTKKNARDIIIKQTSINCKKAISKYKNTLNLQPKRIHKVIFKNVENTSLDSIKDRQGNILTPKGRSPVFGPFLKFGQAIIDTIFVQKISTFR
jgi:hypothetical protein